MQLCVYTGKQGCGIRECFFSGASATLGMFLATLLKKDEPTRTSLLKSEPQLLMGPFVCLSCSRRTGHYTVQQHQSTHNDRHGPSTTTDGANPTVPLPVPRTQAPCGSPRHSPRHSPRSRPFPPCQRCNSQVGGTGFVSGFFFDLIRNATGETDPVLRKMICGVFAFV